MILRAIAWLAFRLWRWADRERALAVRGLPMARALPPLPEPTPDEALDDSLAWGSEADAEAGDLLQEQKPIETPAQPMQCALAKGAEYTLEPISWRITPLPKGHSGFVRRYTSPYHVLVNGRLACEPNWEPEPGISTHSVLHIQENRLCRAPACRALWQPERDRARESQRDRA